MLKEIRARCSQRAEPTPGWWSGHQPGRAIATLRGIMEGVISRTVSFSSPVGEVKEELFFISGKLTRRHTVLREPLQK